MKIIMSASQKGGSGKSFLCLHTAGALAEQGEKVLLCDMDQQGNLSSVFFDSIYELEYTLDDLLCDNSKVKTEDVIQATHIENIYILPANIHLSNLDVRLVGDYDAQTYLAEVLRPVKNEFDYILIDCPPSLGLPTRMAMVAAEGVIIPTQCEEWALVGAGQVASIINQVQKRANPKLRLLGLVINKYKSNRVVEREYRESLIEIYGDALFETEFGDYVAYAECITEKKPITHYLPRSEQAEAFRQFVEELKDQCQKSLRST